MSIANEIERIQTDKVTIRAKLKEFGLVEDAATLDDCANAMDGITKYGALSPEILEGRSYTIPAGYHDGSGVVKAITDEEGDKTLRYKTQSKNVIPAKQQKSVAPDDGFYALSSVTVEPIPSNYQDVTATTAEPSDVLAGAVFVKKDGTVKAGEMPNNGAVTQTIDLVQQVYRIPKGYHDGNGTVRASMQTMSATPTKEEQTVVSPIGKLLSEVKVAPIPDAYQDVTGVTATADKVLTGSKFVDAEGNVVDGTMYDWGENPDGRTDVGYYELYPGHNSYEVPEGYHPQGLTSVHAQSTTKTATPTKQEQTIVAYFVENDPSEGAMFLDSVTVEPIPDKYQDVSGVTATADKVLEGSKFVDAEGNVVDGTMVERPGMMKYLYPGNPFSGDFGFTEYTIPEGYHDGSGSVWISVDDIKTVTPTKAQQRVVAADGKILGGVIINPIPDEYQDISGVTAREVDVLEGAVFVGESGAELEGAMPNKGAVSLAINGMSTTPSVTIPEGYHNGGGTVSLTDDVENALKAI